MAKKRYRQPEQIDGSHVDYLALGRGTNVNGEVGMISMRLLPDQNFRVSNLLLTLEQVLRLRDDLNFEFDQKEFPAKERLYPDEFKTLD
jgi:hypothetical protein